MGGKRFCSYLSFLQPLTGAYDRTIYACFVLVWGFSACKNIRDHQFILLAVGKFLRTKSMKKAMQTYMYLAVGNLSLSLKKQKKIGLCCQKNPVPRHWRRYNSIIALFSIQNDFLTAFPWVKNKFFLSRDFPQNLEKLFLSKD